MKLVEEWTDDLKTTHKKYHQYYKGIEVYGNEITEHIKDGKVYALHGKIITNLDIEVEPKTISSESAALEIALAHIGAKKYAWEDSEFEEAIKDEKQDPKATHFPTGKLYIKLKQNGNIYVKEDYVITWSYDIVGIEPSQTQTQIFVNAKSNEIESDLSLNVHNGPAVTNTYGTQHIDTEWRGGFKYNFRLFADDNKRKIHTKKYAASKYVKTFQSLPEVTDDDDNWDNSVSNETRAHWAVSTAWDYFQTKFNRNGFDNKGSLIRVSTDYNPANINRTAFSPYDKQINVTFDSIPGSIGIGSFLDICAHEFTHAVIEYSTKLDFKGEPGALGESFGDIFGEVIEKQTLGKGSWIHGANILADRNMENPLLSTELNCTGTPGHPDTYGGTFWADPTKSCDDGGVHCNSTVQSYWYYLLSHGGTHNGITVQGIGVDESIKIVYRSITNYLQKQSNFKDARIGSIQAAVDIFGICSNEVIQTTNAWAAVGVGNTWIEQLSVVSSEDACPDFFPLYIRAETFCGEDADFIWNVPNNWKTTSTVNSPSSNILTIFYIPKNGGAFINEYKISVSTSTSLTSNISIFYTDDCGILVRPYSPNLIDSEINLEVYPNPITDNVTIKLNTEVSTGLIQLFDTNAKLVDEQLFSGYIINLDLSHYVSGVYWAKLKSEQKNSKPFKLIKI